MGRPDIRRHTMFMLKWALIYSHISSYFCVKKVIIKTFVAMATERKNPEKKYIKNRKKDIIVNDQNILNSLSDEWHNCVLTCNLEIVISLFKHVKNTLSS